MIEKIRTEDLKPGMFVIDVSNVWHKFVSLKSKTFTCTEELKQLFLKSGLREVYVDTAKRKDAEIKAELPKIEIKKINFQEEFKKSIDVYAQANSAIKEMFSEIKAGKRLEIKKANDLVIKIVDNILENNFVLVGLGLMRDKSIHLFEQAVSRCILMVAFANEYGLEKADQTEAGVGAMLQDIGMLNIPSSILIKPKLTESDKKEIENHVEYGYTILKESGNISDKILQITAEHHERLDGSGYPGGTKNISLYGQMAAIVDVYSAATTDRGYKKGVAPSAALADILVKGSAMYNGDLVQQFIKSIGIYPFGSLVGLSNGLVGIVTNPNRNDLIHPHLLIIYDTNHGRFIKPYKVVLGSGSDRQFKVTRVVAKKELFIEQNEIYRLLSLPAVSQ